MDASMPVSADQGPRKRTPEGVDVNWLVTDIGWQIPTWMSNELYEAEFANDDVSITASHLIDMFNNLGAAIGKAWATEAADHDTLTFKHWRLPNPRATKMKPVKLVCRLFRHPDYDKIWALVEYAQ